MVYDEMLKPFALEDVPDGGEEEEETETPSSDDPDGNNESEGV